MLSDKPNLVFTDISGRVTIETALPSQQIKQAKESLTPVPIENRNYSSCFHEENRTSIQQYNKALYLCGESKL